MTNSLSPLVTGLSPYVVIATGVGGLFIALGFAALVSILFENWYEARRKASAQRVLPAAQPKAFAQESSPARPMAPQTATV